MYFIRAHMWFEEMAPESDFETGFELAYYLGTVCVRVL